MFVLKHYDALTTNTTNSDKKGHNAVPQYIIIEAI